MVLDASAFLALLNAEPGWERVAEVLPRSVISSVNLAEVVGKLVDHGVPEAEIGSLLAGLSVEVAPFDRAAAMAAGELRRIDGGRQLSLGDRACLALARLRGEAALTADRYWIQVDAGAEVLLLR